MKQKLRKNNRAWIQLWLVVLNSFACPLSQGHSHGAYGAHEGNEGRDNQWTILQRCYFSALQSSKQPRATMSPEKIEMLRNQPQRNIAADLAIPWEAIKDPDLAGFGKNLIQYRKSSHFDIHHNNELLLVFAGIANQGELCTARADFADKPQAQYYCVLTADGVSRINIADILSISDVLQRYLIAKKIRTASSESGDFKKQLAEKIIHLKNSTLTYRSTKLRSNFQKKILQIAAAGNKTIRNQISAGCRGMDPTFLGQLSAISH